MANELLTVCLPPDAGPDLRAAVAAALAPYDMNGTHKPYQGEWDHWRIGCPGSEFMVVPGHEDDPRLIRDTEKFRGEVREWVPGLCDGGPRRLLDFGAMRARTDAVTADHLLTLEGAWAYDYTLDMDSYLDDLPPDTLLVRLRIHC
ncbi:hypothetical protein [Streptomyces diastatochromogenes]|uniref:Uncharacterized protein n=1 Tax=Streptomyces diastatochromogenes TaxID=42236 RepID=A0A233S2I0_STRDA|nr:hypothetical protein [Streptomyces diastatochromogenes]MCZ0989250.1 hypothetical protein [Streptomyces diastatochromogenes]OXY89852.1 hypothetical protein BEK98_36310 [Streptomyces diastatochromogenes]